VLILADQKYLPFAGPGARRIAVPGNFKTNESHRLDLEGKWHILIFKIFINVQLRYLSIFINIISLIIYSYNIRLSLRHATIRILQRTTLQMGTILSSLPRVKDKTAQRKSGGQEVIGR
jgi:hypothetical protein